MEFEMELRCPDCASPEVGMIDRGTRLECGNCGADFLPEEAFVSVADAEAFAYEADRRTAGPARRPDREVALFRFDADRARCGINDPGGAIWPVNSFADADELNGLFEAAVKSGVIASLDPSGFIHIYPLSISEPEPMLAISRSSGPSLLGYSLKLRERDGENPLEFTLRLLEETVEAANALICELTDRSSA
jgi:hypothetical protein